MGMASKFRVVGGARVLADETVKQHAARPSPYRQKFERKVSPISRTLKTPLPPNRKNATPQRRWPGTVMPHRYLPYRGPLYTISIAAYRCVEQTARCLDLVARCSPQSIEVVLTDNGSPAREAAELARLCATFGPRFHYLRQQQNLGFGAAHNHVLATAKGIYFVVLNNDVDVQHGWLDGMRALMVASPDVGIVGPLSSAMHVSVDMRSRPAEPAHADYVEGSCLMMRTMQARKLGLFDPEYTFAYCEDADLSLRMRRRGWSIAFTEMRLPHQRAVTAKLVRSEGQIDVDAHLRRNQQILLQRWERYLTHRTFGERVLVRRSRARGDVLWTTPILRAIRAENAHAEVWVETDCEDVLAGNPFVDQVVKKVPHGQEFDRVIDLDECYERTPKRRVVESYAAEAGISMEDIDHVPSVYPSRDDREWARSVLPKGRIAVMHPASNSWPGRCWPKECYVSVARWLESQGYTVAVIGATSDTPGLGGDALDLRGEPLGRSAAVIERGRVFVGVDAAPMHIAQASLIPIVAIYGAVDPKWWLLPIPFFRAARAEHVPCLGCHHEQPPPKTSCGCYRDRVYCMEELTVGKVCSEVEAAVRAWDLFWETGKLRERVLPYCKGEGVDLGCGRDKVTPAALGVDDDSWPEADVIADVSGPLPFDDARFDYVYSSHALEDLSDTEAHLREWTRILRRGGHLILMVPTTGCFTGVNCDHVHEGWRASELSSLVEEAGCVVVESFEDVGKDRYSTVVVGRKR